jgi:hypothetical protein
MVRDEMTKSSKQSDERQLPIPGGGTWIMVTLTNEEAALFVLSERNTTSTANSPEAKYITNRPCASYTVLAKAVT